MNETSSTASVAFTVSMVAPKMHMGIDEGRQHNLSVQVDAKRRLLRLRRWAGNHGSRESKILAANGIAAPLPIEDDRQKAGIRI